MSDSSIYAGQIGVPGAWTHPMEGSGQSWRQLQDFLAADAEREISAFLSPQREHMARVIVVRHGMGSHNSFHGIGSIMNEDAELNDCGKAQADMVGDILRSRGVTAALDRVVVSPFTRTLQTACHLLGENIGCSPDTRRAMRAARFGYSLETLVPTQRSNCLETIVQPLCAEDTLARSHVCRGNRGSTAEELAQRPEFNHVFDWSELRRYCEQRRVAAKDLAQAGKWWHHGPHNRETEGSFQRRMSQLKKWLGGSLYEKVAPKTMIITHGGVMEEGFGCRPLAPNCGFRVFDIAPGGATLHISRGVWLDDDGTLADPIFQVHAVIQRDARTDGHHVYDIELGIGTQTFTQTLRESQLRTTVHDVVKEQLQPEAYTRLRLRGKFPRYALVGRVPPDPSIHIQDYLEQLAIAMGDSGFAGGLARHIDQHLLGGRLFHTFEEAKDGTGPCFIM